MAKSSKLNPIRQYVFTVESWESNQNVVVTQCHEVTIKDVHDGIVKCDIVDRELKNNPHVYPFALMISGELLELDKSSLQSYLRAMTQPYFNNFIQMAKF